MFIWQRKLKYRLGITGRRKKYTSSGINRRRRAAFFKCGKLICIFAVFILFTIYIINDVESRVNPLINNMAISNLNSVVLRECNSAVSDLIGNYDISYDSLVDKSAAGDGSVKSLSIDYNKLNVMKSDLAVEVQTRIDQINSVDIQIPLMAFISDRFYSGIGIPITLRVLTDEDVKVDFDDEFVSVGINQTKHLIKVRITTDIGLNVPIRNSGDAIVTEVPIAESIIAGDTPSTYIDFN